MGAMQEPIINRNGVTRVQGKCHLLWMIAHGDVIRFDAIRCMRIDLRKGSVYWQAPMMSAR